MKRDEFKKAMDTILLAVARAWAEGWLTRNNTRKGRA